MQVQLEPYRVVPELEGSVNKVLVKVHGYCVYGCTPNVQLTDHVTSQG